VTTYQQIYRVARHLLGRLADSHVTPNTPGMHERQQEVALAHVARQEQDDLVNSLQLRVNETQSALVRAIGSSTPRREKIADPPKYSGDRAG
jgi:hypothetical protein